MAWLAVFAVLALVVIRATRNRPMANGWVLVLTTAAVALVLNILAAGLVFVDPSERGVVVSIAAGGVRQQALQPGLHWVIPFAETVVPYTISRQTYTMSVAPEEGAIRGDDSIDARTSDGQIVKVDASVIFAVDPNQVVGVHIEWQDRYIDGVVRPITRGIIRNAVAQFGVEEVYGSKRVEMSNQITAELG